MTDRKRYHDTREELRRVQRTVKHLTDAIRQLTEAQMHNSREQRATRTVVYNAVADWMPRGLTRIERNTLEAGTDATP